jgi:hypothetical protein
MNAYKTALLGAAMLGILPNANASTNAWSPTIGACPSGSCQCSGVGTTVNGQWSCNILITDPKGTISTQTITETLTPQTPLTLQGQCTIAASNLCSMINTPIPIPSVYPKNTPVFESLQ